MTTQFAHLKPYSTHYEGAGDYSIQGPNVFIVVDDEVLAKQIAAGLNGSWQLATAEAHAEKEIKRRNRHFGVFRRRTNSVGPG